MRAHRLLVAIAWLAAAGPVSAQLTDLQPGRNYPSSLVRFGANGSSEDIDAGDIDNDGDWDVLVADGGNVGAQLNPVYVNQGGVQGGTIGDFADETALRMVGVPADTSRDVELLDFEGDGDLDVYVANHGTTVNGGEVSRAHVNLGGAQLGAVGFFTEATDAFWGTLVSVPASQEEGTQDGEGPWRDFSCDCDFADLDDDGDLDLFHGSYGPNINGTEDSRVFLNDGSGRFDELSPWVDPGADIRLHTLDVDLADFDGDWDIDIFASSRETQVRVYRNNLYGGTGAGAPFTDVTQSAVLDQGSVKQGNSNYEAEYADIDGDGDFDVWLADYAAFEDVALRNDGGLVFTPALSWIQDGSAEDHRQIDFLDYDGDGDLDLAAAGYSSPNFIYQSGAAQGLTAAQGFLHRTGDAGGLAPQSEVPAGETALLTTDVQAADVDGDGDPDLLVARDFGFPNRYWENELGVPDAFAPSVAAMTLQPDKIDGTDTVVHAAVRDNAPHYIVWHEDVRLFYRLGTGDETCVPMAPQGGQQFRAVIPAALNGHVTYRVEVTDHAGNTGTSTSWTYHQRSETVSPWRSLGCGTAGVRGIPVMTMSGDGTAGGDVTLALDRGPPSAPALLLLSATSTPTPFKGGRIYAFPAAVMLDVATDAGGLLWLSITWPPLPTGTELFWQCLLADATAQGGVSLSNAVVSTQE